MRATFAIIATFLVLCSGSVSAQSSRAATINFHAEVAKILRVRSAQPLVSAPGVEVRVYDLGSGEIRIEGTITASDQRRSLQIPLTITSNLSNFLVRAENYGSQGIGSIQLAAAEGAQVLSRFFSLDRQPCFAQVNRVGIALPIQESRSVVELLIEPAPDGPPRRLAVTIRLVRQG